MDCAPQRDSAIIAHILHAGLPIYLEGLCRSDSDAYRGPIRLGRTRGFCEGCLASEMHQPASWLAVPGIQVQQSQLHLAARRTGFELLDEPGALAFAGRRDQSACPRRFSALPSSRYSEAVFPSFSPLASFNARCRWSSIFGKVFRANSLRSASVPYWISYWKRAAFPF